MIILQSYGIPADMQAEFWEKHIAVLQPEPLGLAAGQSVIEDIAIHESYKGHLDNLGLVEVTARCGHKITPLGGLFLRAIGFPTDPP